MTNTATLFSTKHILSALLALTLLLAFPVAALELDEAKASGQVGETHTGYLGVVKSSQSADTLVAEINARRKARYQQIATKNGISLEAVEARAGLKAIEKTPPGGYVNTGSGWQKK